ncbi:GPI-GlcNAc transferase complex, PIG-H component [Musa troglodytarum]|uniref:GPI-GlcNAc transferase complex, PIG-H component n=1 Tax=Musa troglodytarum TaxID=320322 RepID=A0A9E7I392_9LILI|nr:GPI-GlcNAc transferase complex, PIG-H component [Musa troglodytarum]
MSQESVVIMPAFGVQLETHYWRLISPFWLLAFGVHARHVHVNQIQARNEVSGWEQWLRTQYESHQVDDVSWHTYE